MSIKKKKSLRLQEDGVTYPQLESGCRQDLKPAALTTVILTHAWIQWWPSLLYPLACLSELLHSLSVESASSPTE